MNLYHGSTTPDIKVLEPRIRYTPGSMGKGAPQAIYAADEPAYAAAHAFPWASIDGIDVVYEQGKVVLIVPSVLKDRLNQTVYVYEVPGETFSLLDTEPRGHNFMTLEKVTPTGCVRYRTVIEAVEENGGSIRYV